MEEITLRFTKKGRRWVLAVTLREDEVAIETEDISREGALEAMRKKLAWRYPRGYRVRIEENTS
jgi:hypothetical protein